VRAELDTASSPTLSSKEDDELIAKAAEVQQGLFELRKKRERIPRFVYERYRDQHETDMREPPRDSEPGSDCRNASELLGILGQGDQYQIVRQKVR